MRLKCLTRHRFPRPVALPPGRWRAPPGASSRACTPRQFLPSTHSRFAAPLVQVAGTTGRIQQDLHNEEEEGISAETHGQAIVEALGWDK